MTLLTARREKIEVTMAGDSNRVYVLGDPYFALLGFRIPDSVGRWLIRNCIG
jgi:hypothetical protein